MNPMSLTSNNLAYLAGIIDGEGSIMLDPPRTDKRGKSTYRNPSIVVSTTDIELMDWLKENYGGTVTNKKTYKEHHKPSFTWRVSHRKATELAYLLVPFLKINRKRLRAEHFAKLQAAINRGGQYTSESLAKREQLEKEFYEL